MTREEYIKTLEQLEKLRELVGSFSAQRNDDQERSARNKAENIKSQLVNVYDNLILAINNYTE